ncbi:hypothetical protein GXP67_02640 [Rhodocytophaga rosea]|uniref:Uncharacterized protein n=1 Tax=Rhodocytophaga rosea TaxID=2704465 RepID=A0A6C0GD70_9BACT|nr:hypothetical protein [Rhodocytophaga rosea]QHT65640.1 hypothetical protein GXP67_02640 [Rhodocytophaga rosea]
MEPPGKLSLKENIIAIPWQGKLNFADKNYINYTLFPVKESLVLEFINFVTTRYTPSASATDSVIVKEKDYETVLSYKVRIDSTWFGIEYLKTKRTLTFNTHYSQEFSDTCRRLIERISKDFNNALSKGKYQEHFLPFPDEAPTQVSTKF